MPRFRSFRTPFRTGALLGIPALLGLALGLPALLSLAACGGGAGHLTASVDTLDFGRVDHGAEPERRFQVKNEGSRSVVIASIEPSCKACLRVETGWRRSLGPGEQTEVVVHLTTGLVPAQKLEGKTLRVVSDDEKTPLLQIPVEGEIETRLTLSPAHVRVGPGDGAGRGEPRRLRLRPGHGYEVKIDRIEILHPDWFELPAEKLPEGYDLLLGFKPDPARRGPVNSHIRVHATVTGRGLPPQKYEETIVIKGTW